MTKKFKVQASYTTFLDATVEADTIEQALRRTGGNKSQAADMLGMKRTTLTAKLKVLEAAV